MSFASHSFFWTRPAASVVRKRKCHELAPMVKHETPFGNQLLVHRLGHDVWPLSAPVYAGEVSHESISSPSCPFSFHR